MKAMAVLSFALLWFCVPRSQLTSNMRLAASMLRVIAGNHTTARSKIHAQYVSAASQRPMQYANRGDVASGRIIREENDELDLDTSPCNGDRIVRFHKPYEKSVIRQAKCGDKPYDRTQVEQR